MRTLRKLTLAASLAVMVVAGIAIGHTAGAATGHVQLAGTSTVHSVTVRGIDFRSLDYRVVPQHVENTGGGIYAQIPGPNINGHLYLEADPYMPVGAQLKDVTFYYRDCGQHSDPSVSLGTWYVFAYAPSSSTGSYVMPQTPSPERSCFGTVPFTHTFSPTVKVAAGKVYAIGVDSGFASSTEQPIDDPRLLIVGARVRYTCPNGC
jgi:hypothetical protein